VQGWRAALARVLCSSVQASLCLLAWQIACLFCLLSQRRSHSLPFSQPATHPSMTHDTSTTAVDMADVISSRAAALPSADCGVVWNESQQKWEAHDVFGFRDEHIGVFASQDAASDALNLILPATAEEVSDQDIAAAAAGHVSDESRHVGRVVQPMDSSCGQWLATLRVPHNPGKLLGLFETIQDAQAACEIARQQHGNRGKCEDSEVECLKLLIYNYGPLFVRKH
jgi:hypothetical protein